MNMPGKTIEERADMRQRMLKITQGIPVKTYTKYLGEAEHRRIARAKIGRDLASNEVVHHKDGDRHNNKPSNLEVMTKSKHMSLHMKLYWERQRAKK